MNSINCARLIAELRERGVESSALRHQLDQLNASISGKRAAKLLRGEVEPTVVEYVAMLRFVDRVLPEWDSLPVVPVNLAPKLTLVPIARKLKKIDEGKLVLLAICRARESLLRTMPTVNQLIKFTEPVTAESAPTLLSGAVRSLWDAAVRRGSDPHAALSAFCIKVSCAVLARTYAAFPADWIERYGDEAHAHRTWIAAVQNYCAAVPTALATRYDTLARFAPTPVRPLDAQALTAHHALATTETAA